jgi:hypothetical protein
MTLSQGWYPDPNDQSRMRFWTGSTWMGERRWNGSEWVDSEAEPGSMPVNGLSAQSPAPQSSAPQSPAPQPTVPIPVAPFNLASVQSQIGALRVRMTATAWLLFGGAAVVVVSSFFPWIQGTISDGFGDSYSETESLSGAGRFIVIAFGIAIVAIGWPVMSNVTVSAKRRIGLTVLVAILTLLALLFTASASAAGNTSGISKPGPGFGTILCWVALVAVWLGLIRVWIRRNRLVSTLG